MKMKTFLFMGIIFIALISSMSSFGAEWWENSTNEKGFFAGGQAADGRGPENIRDHRGIKNYRQVWESVPGTPSSSFARVKRFKNLSGDYRYVVVAQLPRKPNPRERDHRIRRTAVYLSKEALELNDPKRGFKNKNSFDDSCAPDAAMNLFRWWGIDKRAGLPAGKAGVERLGKSMKTNKWKIGISKSVSIDPGGTITRMFVKVAKRYLVTYTPPTFVFRYDHPRRPVVLTGSGQQAELIRKLREFGDRHYESVRHLLSSGCPVVVNYKSGSKKGHFAVIIGLDSVPDGKDGFSDKSNDKVIFANAKTMTWGEFMKKWARDYGPFTVPILRRYGEHPHTMVFIAPKSVLASSKYAGS